jgi:hypothetical protein
MSPDNSLILAVTYRSPYLFTALAQGDCVLEVRRHRLTEVTDFFIRMRWLIQREIVAYEVAEVVVEPKKLTEAAVKSLDVAYRTMKLDEAKRLLLDEATGRSEHKFMRGLLARHEELRRFVHVLPTGNIARQEKWRTCTLVPAALALAAGREPSKT